MICKLLGCAAIAAVSFACAGEGKPTAEDRFEGQAVGGKADGGNIGLVGTLTVGTSGGAVWYQKPPRYLAYAFEAGGGDTIDVRVRALDGGDPVAWVLDADGVTLGFNDDEAATSLDSRIQLAMVDSPDPTHYVVFRDYDELPGLFEVTLDGELDYTSCKNDGGCAMVEAGCCELGDWVAVRSDRADEYQASLQCTGDETCPKPPIFDLDESAICDNNSHTCEVVLPSDIQCGGRALNPHECPDGYECVGPALAVDGFGTCEPI